LRATIPTLVPYTTLFRSPEACADEGCCDTLIHSPAQPLARRCTLPERLERLDEVVRKHPFTAREQFPTLAHPLQNRGLAHPGRAKNLDAAQRHQDTTPTLANCPS